MEGLIPVVNRLQDVFNSIGQRRPPLDLPQIVVIGSQSSGKSSVLESVVGRGFLPRGAGICTRRPLVLQLYQSETDEEWAEFLHVPNRKFTDFDEVRREIEIETDRETGRNKGMSSKAIRLKVFSPNVLNLTLVDLPGITKVPVGDQPKDIEAQTRDMCLDYVSNPLSIILAVSPANADLANSDALKLAREVDPEGNRTIGILTKLDLVDDGVDALDALSGNLIPLKLGYIGIINRSQAEINANTPIQEVRNKERAFFLNHPSYRAIASRQGTEFLTKTLNNILLQHIREHLPDLKANVQKQLREVERELALLGSEACSATDRTAQGQLILSLLSRYSSSFVNSVDGRQTAELHSSAAAPGSGLCGGARLSRAFRTFSDKLQGISPFQNLTDSDIGTAIMNATGPRPSLFVPELSFEVLVKRQLGHLQSPALTCVDDVLEILQEVADQACFAGLARFENLRQRVLDTVGDILADSVAPTRAMIENLIRVEQAFINTSHPDFMNQLHNIRSNNCIPDPVFEYPVSAQATNAMRAIDSSSSVASMASEGRNGRRATSSIDLDHVTEALENVSTNGHHPGTSSNASSDDEREGVSASTTKKSSNFMSFIFNERVSGGNSTSGLSSGLKAPSPVFTSLANGGLANKGAYTPAMRPNTGGALLPDSLVEESEADSQIRIIKRLIESYLAISRKNVLDLTPKTIMYFLVNQVKENVHTELIRALYQEELFDDLLKEDEAVAMMRTNYRETAEMLRKAMSVLSSVRDFKLS